MIVIWQRIAKVGHRQNIVLKKTAIINGSQIERWSSRTRFKPVRLVGNDKCR